jgi:tetratricopeptide (TPR) repeat protein
MSSQNPVVDDLLDFIAKARWPGTHRSNAALRARYEQGLDMVNAYRGDPRIYFQALSLFQSIDACGYAYAGIAFTLAMASSERQNQIYPNGYNAALDWLEKAQEWEPNRVEINFIEAVLYINSGQFENGRLILDYLSPAEPDNYFLCLTEINYWGSLKRAEKALHWIKQAFRFANSQARQANVHNALAHYYMQDGYFVRAIKHYTEVIKLDPNDAWAWHNMSYMFLRLNALEDAAKCNEKALGIMEFQAARQIEEQIQQKKPKGFFQKLRR